MKIQFVLLFSIVSALVVTDIVAQETDDYGGWTDIKGTATDAFHLESFNGFVAVGVNHLRVVKSQGLDEFDLCGSRRAAN